MGFNSGFKVLIRQATYNQIMRYRARYNIDIYSKTFISEIYIFNLAFLTSKHYI